MEFALLLAVGIGLYLLADWILRAAERAAGRIFEQRTLIFFVLLLGMALVAFALIRLVLTPPLAGA